MLSAHASASTSNDAIHSTNSALSGNSCELVQESICPSMEHSIFVVNPSNKTAFGNETWVLDTGATYHIVHSITLFTKIIGCVSTFVQLPNGEKVTVTHIGTIQVTSTLILENVLCVPTFTFNLISVSKLTKSLSYCLVFLSNYCFILDLTGWKTIGVGKIHHNLYLLKSSSICNSVSEVSFTLKLVFKSFVNHVSTISKPNLWHLKLGHVSDDKLQALHHCLPNVPSSHSNKDCIVCPIAKQKRLPFPFFNHISSIAFDLIHYDVWGPFVKATHDGFQYFLTIVDDATRSTWLYPMKSKSETIPLLISFYNTINT